MTLPHVFEVTRILHLSQTFKIVMFMAGVLLKSTEMLFRLARFISLIATNAILLRFWLPFINLSEPGNIVVKPQAQTPEACANNLKMRIHFLL